MSNMTQTPQEATLTTGAAIVINQYGWYLVDPEAAPLTPAEAAEAWAKYDECAR